MVVAMVVSLMLVFGFHMARRGDGQTPAAVGALMGKPAPDFTLQSLDGKSVHLTDFRGKAVLLNFWATWCEPCKIEMPWFVELQKQYGPEGLQIVGISADEGDSKDGVSEFAKTMGVNYPILLGKEAVVDAYGGVQFLPTTFYIDRNGKIVDRVFGLKGKGEIEDDVKRALAEKHVQAQK
jgi:peroxiredoxin